MAGVTQHLVVLGTGGNALDVMDTAEAINALHARWDLVGVLDDAGPGGAERIGLRNLGRLADAAALAAPGGALAGAFFVNTIGSQNSHAARPDIVARTGLPGERFAVLVHPFASISRRAVVGRGCCVNAGASIASNVRIGEHVWIGPNCILGHDTVVESHAVMAPGSILSGSVRLGMGAYFGTGAAARQGVTIGAGALVGMGAVVLRDVPAGRMVVGNPARELRRTVGD
jgi:sugar O-acyltransferase (sialic acid O-acetyltransferase NeuD family)